MSNDRDSFKIKLTVTGVHDGYEYQCISLRAKHKTILKLVELFSKAVLEVIKKELKGIKNV